MKISTIRPYFLGCSAVFTAALLTNCVDPYAGGGSSQSVTTFSAGTEVRSLPPGYRREVIEGRDYYYSNGRYYRPQSGRYVIVEAPRTRREAYRESRYDQPRGRRDVIITELPRGYRTVERSGVRYYKANDTYYQRQGSGYVIVSRPF